MLYNHCEMISGPIIRSFKANASEHSVLNIIYSLLVYSVVMFAADLYSMGDSIDCVPWFRIRDEMTNDHLVSFPKKLKNRLSRSCAYEKLYDQDRSIRIVG